MSRHTIQDWAERLVAGFILFLMLLSLALSATGADKKKEQPKKLPTLVWPLPPEKPRIKFVDMIYGAGNVEAAKKANLFDRIAGIERKDFKPGFIKPYGIATDSRGRIYVVDSGQRMIFVLDLPQKKVTYIGQGLQARLLVPIGITVDSKDRVWVADAVGQHVYAFDGEGNVLMALGKQDEMVNPTAVAVDETRHRLYVVDSKQHAVLVYDSETGASLAKFGERGSEPGQFNFPTNVVVDREGKVYVADTINCRIQIFSPEYKFVDTFGKQGTRLGDFLKPKGLALDDKQNLYVVDSDFMNFQIFDQKKRLLMFLGGYGRLPGAFWLPAGIHIDRQNRIYIADQNNGRIQIFQLLNSDTEDPAAGTPQATPPNKTTNEKKGGG